MVSRVTRSMVAAVVGVEIQRERAGTRVDPRDRVVERVVGDDRQQRAEDFLLHQRAFVRRIRDGDQRKAAACLIGRAVGQRVQLRAGGLRFVGETLQPREMPLRDDRRVVEVARKVGVHRRHPRARPFDERLLLAARHQHIVRRDAGLTRVERLAGDEVIHRVVEARMLTDDGRRLAAQFERDRRQMFGGGAHHFMADLGRAGE